MCACIKASPDQWGWEQLGEIHLKGPFSSWYGHFHLPDEDATDNADHVNFKPPGPRSGKWTVRLGCRNAVKEITSLTYLSEKKTAAWMLGRRSHWDAVKAKAFALQQAGTDVILDSPKKSRIRRQSFTEKNLTFLMSKLQSMGGKSIPLLKKLVNMQLPCKKKKYIPSSCTSINHQCKCLQEKAKHSQQQIRKACYSICH